MRDVYRRRRRFLCSVTLVSAAPPLWWSTGNPPVIDPNATTQNHGVANIGQAKWMAKNALEALRAKRPAIAYATEKTLLGIAQLERPDYRN